METKETNSKKESQPTQPDHRRFLLKNQTLLQIYITLISFRLYWTYQRGYIHPGTFLRKNIVVDFPCIFC